MTTATNSSFMRDSLHLLASNGASMCFRFAAGILLARVLGPEGQGVVVAILVIPMLINTLSAMGIWQSVVYFMGMGKYSDAQIINTISVLYIISSSFGLGLCWIAYAVQGNPEFTWLFKFLAILTIPFGLIVAYARGVMAGKGRLAVFAKFEWCGSLAFLLCAIIFVWYFQLGILGALLSYVVAVLPIATWALFSINRVSAVKIIPDWQLMRNIVFKGFAFAVSLFVVMLSYRVSIIFLERFGSFEWVAYFHIALIFAELIWKFPAAIGTATFSRSARAEDPRAFSLLTLRLNRVSFLICGLVALMVFFAAPHFIPIIYGSEYSESGTILQILIPGILAMVTYKTVKMDMAGRGKPLISLYVAIPSIILNGILSYFWIPSHGTSGAAAALSISYLAMVVCYLFVYLRVANLKIGNIVCFRPDDFEFCSVLLKKVRRKFQ